jgi:hypothetical protein
MVVADLTTTTQTSTIVLSAMMMTTMMVTKASVDDATKILCYCWHDSLLTK